MFECLPVDEFSCDERRAICLADFMNGDDVWMIKRGYGLRLLDEAAQALFVIGKLRGQKLQRNSAIEFRITGKIDLTHSPFTERRNDLIVSHDLSRHESRLRVRDHAHLRELLRRIWEIEGVQRTETSLSVVGLEEKNVVAELLAEADDEA